MTRPIAFSLPGMVRDEKITRSPRDSAISGCSSAAMRASAARGSPWLPVQSATTLSRRQIAIDVHAAELLHPFEIAGLARDLITRSMARPTTTTSRPAAARGVGDGADARDVGGEGGDRDARAARLRSASASVRATSVSDGERPSRTALVELPISARQPSAPSARSLASSVGGPITGVGSIFQSPVCSTLPCGVRRISALDSGIECATETSSMSNGPTLKRRPSATSFTGMSGAPGSPCALGLEQRRGERRRVDRHLQLAARGRTARRNGPRARG